MSGKTQPPCPKCAEKTKVISLGKKYTMYPTGCLTILGLPLAILHGFSLPFRYECATCGKSFKKRGLPAKLSIFGMIVLALSWVVSMILVLAHN